MWQLITSFLAPTRNLSLRDSPPHPHTPLSTVQPLLLRLCDLRALLHNLLAFGQDQLNVARVRHVRIDLQIGHNQRLRSGKSHNAGLGVKTVEGFWTYTTVSTVGATALLGCLVDLDVLDDQIAGVEAFGVGV